jgi:electron transfer flavoprotein beta subunit
MATGKETPVKIVVCIKQVPRKDDLLRLDEARNWVDESSLSFEANESDTYALEEALRLKEAHGGEVVAVTLGPAEASKTIKEALAKGADRAFHLLDPRFERLDAIATARALAAAIAPEGPDLVLTGLQSDDMGFGQTGVLLAESLGLPHASIVIALESADGTTVRAKRELESGWFQWVTMRLPAVVTIQSGINKPRYASLKGIMNAKKKTVEQKTAESLGLTEADLEAREVRHAVYFPVKAKTTEVLEGDAETVAAALVERLRAGGLI